MTFRDCDDEVTSGLFFKLEGDGDSVKLIFADEPFTRPGDFHGKDRTQFCFPIVTAEGLQVWTTSQTNYIDARDHWQAFSNAACQVTRHGKANNKKTYYEFKPCAMSAALKKVYADISRDDIAELVDSVQNFDKDDPTKDI